MAAHGAGPALVPSQTVDDSMPNSVTSTPSASYRIEMINPAELLNPSRQNLLHSLNDLINDAYLVHGHPRNNRETGSLYTEMRINGDDQLVHELGSKGLLAICFDDNLPDTHTKRQHRTHFGDPSLTVFGEPYRPGKYGRIVATASLKPWKGKTVDVFRRAQQELAANGTAQNGASNVPMNDMDLAKVANQIHDTKDAEHAKTWDWEVAACASVDDPRYRGQGLMIKCLDALVERLVDQRNAFRKLGDPQGDLQVKLWSSALESSGNTEYWMRRGFVKEGEADVAPKGLWSATREIKIQTLSKVVE